MMQFVDKDIAKNSQSNLDLIKSNMVSFPTKILTLRSELIDINQDIADLKDELKGLESDLLLELSNDKELKNQAQRDAKLFLACQNSEQYQSIKNDLKEKQNKRQKNLDIIDYYEQQFSVMKKFHNEHMTILQSDIWRNNDEAKNQQ